MDAARDSHGKLWVIGAVRGGCPTGRCSVETEHRTEHELNTVGLK